MDLLELIPLYVPLCVPYLIQEINHVRQALVEEPSQQQTEYLSRFSRTAISLGSTHHRGLPVRLKRESRTLWPPVSFCQDCLNLKNRFHSGRPWVRETSRKGDIIDAQGPCLQCSRPPGSMLR